MQRRFHIGELQRFLQLVDAELAKPCTLVVVGEAAMLLGYCPDQTIVDIEIWSASDRVIWTAAERASEKIARPIHLRQALAGSARGMSFETRLQPTHLDGLRFLTVLIPEPHDLALLSAAHEPSWAALAELHRAQGLYLGTLLERHEEMKGDESAPAARATAGLLAVVAKLYGTAKAEEIERQVMARPSTSTPHRRG